MLLPREYPPGFGLRLLEIHADLLANRQGCPPLPAELPSMEEMLSTMSMGDIWPEADLEACLRYIRGGTSLQLSPALRALLPTHM